MRKKAVIEAIEKNKRDILLVLVGEEANRALGIMSLACLTSVRL